MVDDEPYITDLLGAALRFEGFTRRDGRHRAARPSTWPSGAAMIWCSSTSCCPTSNGTEVCRRLRAEGIRTPVLFLTARDATEDKVGGAHRRGRRLRDQAVQPRRAGGPDPRRAPTHGQTRRDRPESTACSPTWRWTTRPTRSGARASSIELTATEFNLLRYLLENARRVLSKSEILDHVWNYDFDGDPNIVETYISYLRKKIDCFDPPLIHTIRGVGYSLRLPRDTE